MGADLDDVVSVTITTEDLTPSQLNFGKPLIAAFFPPTVFPERSREYSKVSEAIADGFDTNAVVIRKARVLIQNPKVKTFKIGRKENGTVQLILLTPNDTTEGFIVTVTIISPDGTATVISRTNGAAETPTTIATALTALITAIVGLTATDNTGSLNADADTLGDLFDFTAIAGLAVLDQSVDPGVVADLTAIRAFDSDFYGVTLDSNSKLEIAPAAAWAEAETLIFGAESSDDEVLQDTAGNIAETLEVAAYDRTFLLWSGTVLSGAAGAWIGDRFPADPGASTWKFKQLTGIARDAHSTTAIANLRSNNANFYIARASINVTCDGTMASGRFIDITRTSDALIDQLQVEIFTLQVNLAKIPYTNASVSLAKSVIRGVIREFQGSSALDPETAPIIEAPLVEDVSTIDRGNRLLPDIEFSARIAGAIHEFQITGVLTI